MAHITKIVRTTSGVDFYDGNTIVDSAYCIKACNWLTTGEMHVVHEDDTYTDFFLHDYVQSVVPEGTFNFDPLPGGTLASSFEYQNKIAMVNECMMMHVVDNSIQTNIKIPASAIVGLNGNNPEWANVQNKPSTFTPSAHDHTVSEITDFPASLPPSAHTHPQSEVTGLVAALAGKAASTHSHAIGDTTGLQAALDGKSATGHTHIKSEVGLANVDNTSDANKPVSTAQQAALDGKAAVSHTHTKSQITDFSHTHPQSEITNLVSDLAGKAALSHTHTKSQITDFAHTHVKADITDFAHTHPQSDITNLTSDLAAKQATLVSGTNIKSVNGNSLLGSGDLLLQKWNESFSAQSPFASDTYLTGSSVSIPAPVVGAQYKLTFDVTKTAAGTAAPVITVRIGTAGTIADTARLTFTFGAGTAAIDVGQFEVTFIFRTVGSGTAAIIQGTATLVNNLTTTGISNSVKCRVATSAGFDSTVANLIIGASYNGGASASHTIQLVQATYIP